MNQIKFIVFSICAVFNAAAFASTQTTPESCFGFDASNQSITGYFCNPSPGSPMGENVVIPKKINGITVKKIGEGAFYEQLIKSVEIPNGVITIDAYAFNDNELKTVVIPDSVTTIGDYAFSTNALTKVVLSNNLSNIGQGVFIRNALVNVEIPKSVKSISAVAFRENKLKTVRIPSGVITLDNSAFDSGVEIIRE